jgi:hypothetical protein
LDAIGLVKGWCVFEFSSDATRCAERWTPSNMLFKRPKTYLIKQWRSLRGVILEWITKDTRPELLDEVHIIQVDLFPEIVLGVMIHHPNFSFLLRHTQAPLQHQ